jgi:hypothetical protein
MKICPVEAKLLRAKCKKNGWPYRQTDKRTDMVKLIVAFCNFGNVPKTVHTRHLNYKNIMKWFHKSMLILDFSNMLSN